MKYLDLLIKINQIRNQILSLSTLTFLVPLILMDNIWNLIKEINMQNFELFYKEIKENSI